MNTISTRKIRVLQIVKGLDIGGVNGGAERFGVDLARSLPKDLYEVSICAFFRQETATEKYWADRIEQEGIRLFYVSNWAGNNQFGTYIRGILNLLKVLRPSQIDICHSHFQLGTIVSIFLKGIGFSRSALRTAHLAQEWEKSWYGRFKEIIFSNWIFPVCLDAEAGVSQTIVNGLQKHPGLKLTNKQPYLIFNAIELEGLSGVKKPDGQSSNSGKAVVGVVGRLTEQKGHIYLIEAIQEVVLKIPDVECWVIGDGELLGALEEKVRLLGIKESVVFLGKREDIHSLFNQMDLFVLPSLWEGLPTVIMESMAFGVPVLATDIPGNRDLVEDRVNGRLVPARDPFILSACIVDLLQNPQERRSMAVNAYQSIERFSMKRISQQYQNLYLSIMKR